MAVNGENEVGFARNGNKAKAVAVVAAVHEKSRTQKAS